MSNNLFPDVLKEAKNIQQSTGIYIPPQRLDILMRTAAKGLKSITSIAEFTPTYTECELMINIMRDAIKRAKGE